MQCTQYNAQHLNSVDNIILCTKWEAFSFLSFCYWWGTLCVPPPLTSRSGVPGVPWGKEFQGAPREDEVSWKAYWCCKIRGCLPRSHVLPSRYGEKSNLVFSRIKATAQRLQGSHLLHCRQLNALPRSLPGNPYTAGDSEWEWGEGEGHSHWVTSIRQPTAVTLLLPKIPHS